MQIARVDVFCDVHTQLDEPSYEEGFTMFFPLIVPEAKPELYEVDLCKVCQQLPYTELLSYAVALGTKSRKLELVDLEKKPKTRKKKAPAADLKQIEADLNGIEKQLDAVAPEELPGLCEVGGCTYIVTGPQGYGLHLNRTHDIKEKSLAEKREVARSL